MILINNIKLKPQYSEKDLLEGCAVKLGIKKDLLREVRLKRLSVDACKKNDVHYVASAVCKAAKEKELIERGLCQGYEESSIIFPKAKDSTKKIVIAGFGPAGMFAALTLCKMGYKPVIIERGADVDERKKDVENFFACGELNENSNIQFGEGGAGTFSDGKLTTGVKSAYLDFILQEFVRHGAPHEILYQAKAHIGTDNLVKIVKSIRQEISSLDGQILFKHSLRKLLFEGGKLNACEVEGGGRIFNITADDCLICTGHSARDVYAMLLDCGAIMEQKGFSMGVRIEHLQPDISACQYGTFAKSFPPADYKVNCKAGDRGVYTFCNCPGGVVVASASENGGVVTNGMSYFDRAGKNANSAVLVDVRKEDFGNGGVLAGIDFQRKYEKAAYNEGFKAHCQLAGDFLKDEKSVKFGKIQPTYQRGVILGEIKQCLPVFVTEALRKALPMLARKIPAFSNPDAVLTAIESRSSSPVRILRNEKFMTNLHGVYAAGEGSGYAGGIMSSAADGIKCALMLGQND